MFARSAKNLLCDKTKKKCFSSLVYICMFLLFHICDPSQWYFTSKQQNRSIATKYVKFSIFSPYVLSRKSGGKFISIGFANVLQTTFLKSFLFFLIHNNNKKNVIVKFTSVVERLTIRSLIKCRASNIRFFHLRFPRKKKKHSEECGL